MPLSERSLHELRSLSLAHGFSLLVLEDPYFPLDRHVDSDGLMSFNGYLRAHGSFLHFPNTYIFKNGTPCGSEIPGYKTVQAYADLISQRFQSCIAPPAAKVDLAETSHRIKRTLSYTLEREIHLPPSRYFFKAIGDDGFVVSDGTNGYLHFYKQNQVVAVPGIYDQFPSPDLNLLTIPNPLRFYDLKLLGSHGGDQSAAPPLFTDSSITDEYQSIGLLDDGSSSRKYRAITGWYTTAAYRDYIVQMSPLQVATAGAASTLCHGLQFSLPMISKDGRYMGIRNNATNITSIVNIGVTGSECFEVFSTQKPAGKVSFDYQMERIAFTITENEKIVAYVVNLPTREWIEVVSCGADCVLAFPDFTPSGRVLVMKKTKNGSYLLVYKPTN